MHDQRPAFVRGPLVPRLRYLILLTLAVMLGLSQTGCIQFVANMIHAVHGDNVPAEYEGLADKKVAVITITDTSQYSNDISARMLTRYVSEILKTEVKGIKLVREDEVEQWRDTQGWEAIDYVALGRGVKADKVVSIELTDLRLREGQTMYRGHAGATITVHDVASGSREFRRTLDDYTYPVTAGLFTTETTEDKFRRVYLDMLGQRIARYFHPYDFRDGVADDAKIVHQ
ncbi:hypothetical protein [Candidatus Laterigemmans baculatus]|uniref:hypothetical protein n=1 Tax=Candidatus Laterigemmans baculatus TaxID=2770505 RepID=UPI0013DB972B|nr:hypothetical protein [Candidatus Laterigemmans baculatus]